MTRRRTGRFFIVGKEYLQLREYARRGWHAAYFEATQRHPDLAEYQKIDTRFTRWWLTHGRGNGR